MYMCNKKFLLSATLVFLSSFFLGVRVEQVYAAPPSINEEPKNAGNTSTTNSQNPEFKKLAQQLKKWFHFTGTDTESEKLLAEFFKEQNIKDVSEFRRQWEEGNYRIFMDKVSEKFMGKTQSVPYVEETTMQWAIRIIQELDLLKTKKSSLDLTRVDEILNEAERRLVEAPMFISKKADSEPERKIIKSVLNELKKALSEPPSHLSGAQIKALELRLAQILNEKFTKEVKAEAKKTAKSRFEAERAARLEDQRKTLDAIVREKLSKSKSIVVIYITPGRAEGEGGDLAPAIKEKKKAMSAAFKVPLEDIIHVKPIGGLEYLHMLGEIIKNIRDEQRLKDPSSPSPLFIIEVFAHGVDSDRSFGDSTGFYLISDEQIIDFVLKYLLNDPNAKAVLGISSCRGGEDCHLTPTIKISDRLQVIFTTLPGQPAVSIDNKDLGADAYNILQNGEKITPENFAKLYKEALIKASQARLPWFLKNEQEQTPEFYEGRSGLVTYNLPLFTEEELQERIKNENARITVLKTLGKKEELKAAERRLLLLWQLRGRAEQLEKIQKELNAVTTASVSRQRTKYLETLLEQQKKYDALIQEYEKLGGQPFQKIQPDPKSPTFQQFTTQPTISSPGVSPPLQSSPPPGQQFGTVPPSPQIIPSPGVSPPLSQPSPPPTPPPSGPGPGGL